MIKQFGEAECLPTNVFSGNWHVREFVWHIIVGFSNWRQTEERLCCEIIIKQILDCSKHCTANTQT
jgi:hypothetical protein